MGLVDYSDDDSSASESEVQAPPKPTVISSQPSSKSNSKKPFQKVVDRANPGKILVNLPQVSDANEPASSGEPPSKRAKTAGGGRFSGFNSFLPAPKNANKSISKPSSSNIKVGVGLKTSAAPGFSRDGGGDGLMLSEDQSGPIILENNKTGEEVKPLGKPLMFKPLSVSRGQPKKKKKLDQNTPKAPTPSESHQPAASGDKLEPAPGPAPPPTKVSLFSMHTEEPTQSDSGTSASYVPMFETEISYQDAASDEYAQYQTAAYSQAAAASHPESNSLDSIATDLNLSATQRRELFGRGGGGQNAKKVINFNMEREYEHNEGIRATGEQQIHNPVRALVGGGKHSLQQLVRNVNSQRDALEDSFAKGKQKQKEAASRYGY